MELTLASSNSHKAHELEGLFHQKIKILTAKNKLEVVENGESFEENAFLKANAYFQNLQKPTISDDSGLVIEGCFDILGVNTANFANHLESYSQRCDFLLNELKQRNLENAKAYFCCVLCVVLSPTETFFFEGRVHGHISQRPSGDSGFGYDPIFIPERTENDNLTLAQLPEWKHQFSHRAKAAKSLLQFFQYHL